MKSWHDEAKSLRENRWSYQRIADWIGGGITAEQVRYDLNPEMRKSVYRRVLWQRAIKRGRRAFGTDSHA